MNDNYKDNRYKETKEYAQELFTKGVCMGEVMKKTRLTEDEIAHMREKLDKEE
ncbi:hypothetical protein JMF89_10310 [Clostridiaceae bacterium UIB06]|uniref:Uncharacterized protein n=1 Tax=Clostridium thailandense TaxID=2794346 RepID=A0A949X3L6_9CLOT|nr:hypothetical protein [Clostridium thailandense]MBV7274849.1 hypothetical protein [Clostridium thailandense]MCH5137594.1 hypothetical protein [Clostridiaceae bacterium UIB06]